MRPDACAVPGLDVRGCRREPLLEGAIRELLEEIGLSLTMSRESRDHGVVPGASRARMGCGLQPLRGRRRENNANANTLDEQRDTAVQCTLDWRQGA